jgi:propane monooxygenase large subunit
MGRFSGCRQWATLYHEWDLADCIKDLGFVRNNGKTLVPQPHLHFDSEKMWTLDHVKGYEIRSPLVELRKLTPEQREKHVAHYRNGFSIRRV